MMSPSIIGLKSSHWSTRGGEIKKSKIKELYVFEGLGKAKVDEVSASFRTWEFGLMAAQKMLVKYVR